MENRMARFLSPDKGTTLTITAKQGRSGINVKATMKGVGKDAERAITGSRANFQNDREANNAFDNLVKESESRGWQRTTARVKNAFTEIPAPPKAPRAEGGKKSKAA